MTAFPTPTTTRPRGFRCCDCGHRTTVYLTRTRDRGRRVVRRRVCGNPDCRAEFHTTELSSAKLAELYAAAGLSPPPLP